MHGVGVRELNRHTADVVRSIRDGERAVITRSGDPLGILLSVRDAIELAVSGYLPEYERAAAADIRSGLALEPWPARKEAIVIAGQARTQYRDQTANRAVLNRAMWHAEIPFTWTRHGKRLLACSSANDGTVIVYAIFDAWALERALIGDELGEARSRREAERLLRRPYEPPRRLRPRDGA